MRFGSYCVGERLIENRASDRLQASEGIFLQVRDYLRQRFGYRREVKHRPGPEIRKRQLLAENGFAAARLPHDDVNGVFWKSSAEDEIRFWIAGANAVHAGTPS